MGSGVLESPLIVYRFAHAEYRKGPRGRVEGRGLREGRLWGGGEAFDAYELLVTVPLHERGPARRNAMRSLACQRAKFWCAEVKRDSTACVGRRLPPQGTLHGNDHALCRVEEVR
jgi:hypothetical protein